MLGHTGKFHSVSQAGYCRGIAKWTSAITVNLTWNRIFHGRMKFEITVLLCNFSEMWNFAVIFHLNHLVNSNLIWTCNEQFIILPISIILWNIWLNFYSSLFSLTPLLLNDFSLSLLLHLHACKLCVIQCLSWKTRLGIAYIDFWTIRRAYHMVDP